MGLNNQLLRLFGVYLHILISRNLRRYEYNMLILFVLFVVHSCQA